MVVEDVVDKKDIEEAKKLTEIFKNLPDDGKNQVIGYMTCLSNMETADKEKARAVSV